MSSIVGDIQPFFQGETLPLVIELNENSVDVNIGTIALSYADEIIVCLYANGAKTPLKVLKKTNGDVLQDAVITKRLSCKVTAQDTKNFPTGNLTCEVKVKFSATAPAHATEEQIYKLSVGSIQAANSSNEF